MMKIVRSLCLTLALALSPIALFVARPLTYLVQAVGSESQAARFRQFTLTLAAWRHQAGLAPTSVGSNLTRQGHGFVMKRRQDDYEGFAPA